MDRHAEIGFGRASAEYERGRPEYPQEAVADACARLGLAASATVLDLAAGTGKLTRMLEGRVARITAVEPVEAMRAELARQSPAVETLAGTAEAIPISTGAVDAVFVGQAFHWFDGPRALAEIHRVLSPGGGLALIWNVRDRSVPWVAAWTALLDRHVGSASRHRSNAWRVAFEETKLFTPLETHGFAYEQPLSTIDALVDQAASVSFVAALDDGPRAALLEEVRALGNSHRVTSFPYRTEVHVCKRVD